MDDLKNNVVVNYLLYLIPFFPTFCFQGLIKVNFMFSLSKGAKQLDSLMSGLNNTLKKENTEYRMRRIYDV